MKALKTFGIWLLFFVLMIQVANTIFSPDSDNMVSISYYLIIIVVPIVCTNFLSKSRKHKARKAEVTLPSVELVDDLSPPADLADDLVPQAIDFILNSNTASVSALQRRFKIGYTRSAQVLDLLETAGVIGPFNGSLSRDILITESYYRKHQNQILAKMVSEPEPTPIIHQNTQLQDDFSKFGGIEADLLTIDLMEGRDFEYWCADLLRKLGFTNVEVTPGSGDQGVDILAKKEGIKYAIQCKCYASDLGNKPIQEVHAGKAMYNCQVGAVMTNRHFTAGGRQLAEATGVLLWDRDWITAALEKTK